MKPKLIDSVVVKLFMRFLKDNNVPLNNEAFLFTFGIKQTMEVDMVLVFYIIKLKGLNLFKDDNLETSFTKLKLKWIKLVKENYNTISTTRRIHYDSLSPNYLYAKFSLVSLSILNKKEIRFESYISNINAYIYSGGNYYW